MKYISLSLLFAVLVVSPLYAGRKNVPDSLLTERTIRSLYVHYPDSALRLLAEAEQRRLPGLEQFRIDILRGMCHEIKGEYIAKERYCRQALQNDSVRLVPGRRLTVVGMLASALETQNKYDECIVYCREGIDLARQLGEKKIGARMFSIMGRMYIGMKRREEGLDCFGQSVRLLEDTEDVREMSELSTIYGEQMTAFMDMGLVEEAIAAGRRRESLIHQMSELPGPPPGYIDQQYGFLHAKMALLLYRAGKEQEAAEAYRAYQSTRFSHSATGKFFGIPYLLDAGRYSEALRLNGVCMDAFASDTVSYNYLIALDYYAQAYRGMGQYRLADDYMQRINVLQDSIYSREAESRAQEFATIFRLTEKELQLNEARAVSERRILLLIGSCVMAGLLLVLLGIIGINLHKTRRRNRIAAKQIDELLAQRDKLRRAFAQMDNVLPEAEGDVSSCGLQRTKEVEDRMADKTAGTSDNDTKEHANYAAFMRMEHVVMENKLFLQPKFGREDLLRVTNINKNSLSWLLRTYADAGSISEYLNRLRVEYAVKLMKEKPHHSIDAIAAEASFNSRSTFYRAFYKVFGMSPTQYMQTQ